MTTIEEKHGVIVERRIVITGWKYDKHPGDYHYKRREFTNHLLYNERTLKSERKRIGEEGLPDWQPHITEVYVEERVVTPWRVV